jgi:hypothetical protein
MATFDPAGGGMREEMYFPEQTKTAAMQIKTPGVIRPSLIETPD